MKRTRILVTGASGFVGGSFCRRFSHRKDLDIRGLGRRDTGLAGYIRHDLTRPLPPFPDGWRPHIVIHAAARSSPWGSLAEFRRQNVLATRNVLDFCLACGVRKIVHVSSCSVFYRDEDQFGITEETPIGPDFVNHYARTKHEAEELVRGSPVDWCIVRPRAVFGPGDTVLFPRILRAAAEGRMIAIDRPGPPAVGDLLYIDTLSDYLLRAALDPEAEGEINLTNGEPVEIQALLAELFERLGLPPAKRRVPREKAMRLAGIVEDVHRIFLPWREPPITRYGIGVLAYSKTFDAGRCLRILGPPSVTVREGIERFIAWQSGREG